jgi:hypothetical protein
LSKILVASANPWSFALAVERQLIGEHSADQVDLLNLWSICGRFSPHWPPRARMIERLNRSIERFIRPLITGREITDEVAPDHAAVPSIPADVTELRHYRVNGVPVGLAVLSSVFELTSIHDAHLPDDYGEPFEQAWRSAHLSLQIGDVVAERGYDRVYIFGGRHCYSRPFVDAVSKTTEVLRYEQGGTGTSYVLSDRSLYEPLNLAKIIGSLPVDDAAGKQFFEERLQRSRAWDAGFFTGSQQGGRIPQQLAGRPLVSLFNSSVDEFYAISDEVSFGTFATQGEAALALARICRDEGKAFAIRFHPHLQYKHESWRDEYDFAALVELGAVLIEPDDPTDSYALARASEAVFSCGSTISFECSYLGIPNASLGESYSSGLGVAPVVADEEELRAFIRLPHLLPDAGKNALRLGSFFKNGATPVHGLDVGSHPNFARIDGRIVDPVRYAAQTLREWASNLSGREAENRSGIVEGRVTLPSGPRYRRSA